MARVQRAGQPGAIDVAADQATAKEQFAAMVDMLRQLGGNAAIVAGNMAQADPLSSPFTLYVNPYIGSDKFVGGAYNTFEAGETDEELIASKLKRIELQRLECGYTPYRPFKTINRAVIEAAIITSKNWYTYTDPRAHVDCVSIMLSPGVHIVYNNPGSGSTNLASWGNEKIPTIAELIAFNPATGGVLLPRGCSMPGADLRKCSIRPDWVPEVEDEAADYSNRRSIFKVSGTGYFFGATTMDKIGHTASCHLLDTFHPASRTELDAFYAKVQAAVGTGADLATALLSTRSTEVEIVGPIVAGEQPIAAWDTTASASPYIFNWSVRSDYGIGGAFWDGDKIGGLKSMVCANFTGVSLQKDMRCWQVYENNAWVNLANTPADYQKYISTPPDNVRMNPARLSRHISAVNDAFIQKVSVFAIGHGVMTYVDNGGEIDCNLGNSNFGGCAAIAKGYKQYAFPQDKNWSVGRIRVPLDLGDKRGNIRRIQLGVISAITNDRISLSTPLAADDGIDDSPSVLAREGYTLRAGTKVWVENPTGEDWRADLNANAWSASAADRINLSAALVDSESGAAVTAADAIGKRVYIRRLVDTRTPSERRINLALNNSASARLPERGFVVQTDPTRAGGNIARALAPGGSECITISAAGIGATPGPGVSRTAEVVLRRAAPENVYASGVFYRRGTIVKHAGKHYQALRDITTSTGTPDPGAWGETFVHMYSDYNPEDQQSAESPILVVDTDTDNNAESLNCGINWATAWTADSPIRNQYRTGSDYLGMHAFLVALGFSSAAAHDALVPRNAAGRDRNPGNAVHFPVQPSGGAASGRGFWAIEFRRPSVLSLNQHTWKWAGYGMYSKALPAAQNTLSPQNKFSYYFTHEAGGRVVPQGANEDGFNVSPRGLEDVETGATLSVDALGNSTLDESLQQDFPNGLTSSTIDVRDLTITGNVTFPQISSARVDRLGPIRLASIEQLTATGAGAIVASTDRSLNERPEAVTIAGLNRWRQAQRLISAGTGTLTIYVKAGATDRPLNDLFDQPPTEPELAVPTLARAAEYANAVIGGSNQVAIILMAPGMYNPASIWECSVRFELRDDSQPDWPRIFPGTFAGNANTENDYFDGSGYGSVATRVNFNPFFVTLRPANQAANQLQVGVGCYQMRFKKSVEFIGGFNFLGIPHLIRAIANNELAASQFMVSGSVTLPSSAYTTTLVGDDNTENNVETFLRTLRARNGRNPVYEAFTVGSAIALEGTAADVASINDCCFGSSLPTRKELLGAVRDPYIATNGIVALKTSNIYIIGATEIRSDRIGVTNDLPGANRAHYGSTAIPAPWTWRMTHHTFIGPMDGGNRIIYINELGGSVFYLETDSPFSRVFYKSGNKYLPNHIHLLTINGTEPGNDNTGPFFDQFIHAPNGFKCDVAFSRGDGFAGDTAGAFSRGFVGRFGRNGYSAVKTRGVLLGNQGNFDEERGATVQLEVETRTVRLSGEQAYTIFKAAGATVANIASFMPRFAPSAGASFGDPTPVGTTDKRYNPVITTAAAAVANNTQFPLNMALRSYVRGISPEHGFNITPNAIL
jgi:hypothetical protein